jgi:hypothetical protein
MRLVALARPFEIVSQGSGIVGDGFKRVSHEFEIVSYWSKIVSHDLSGVSHGLKIVSHEFKIVSHDFFSVSHGRENVSQGIFSNGQVSRCSQVPGTLRKIKLVAHRLRLPPLRNE